MIIHNAVNFDIGQTLECGQCFRFEKTDDTNSYFLLAYGKKLNVSQNGDKVKFWYDDGKLDKKEFDTIWMQYFDFERDYADIQAKISSNDTIMQHAIAFAPGIRILQQDPWEMIISFIISANNRIPQIKQVIKNICKTYGGNIGGEHYAFPTPQELAKATAEDLRALKTGFRDKYIVDATKRVLAGEMPVERNCKLPTNELRKTLMETKGIGEKVADCILLFGYGRWESFPIDVWVRRVMEQLYFNGESMPPAKIHAFAKERFGELAGFAQQYLFHYMRLKKTT
ncbi:MAG: N-glycosylase [Defluviitaleaceae bacterium]|nr:N-glycosylase [Defluviitaleaceae bacterium]